MSAFLVGFGAGFVVSMQLGPLSLFLIRSTLRGSLAVGVAIGAVDSSGAAAAMLVAGVGVGSLAWVTLLALGVAAARKRVGRRLLATLDSLAGSAIMAFGGLLAWRTLRDA